MKCTVADVTRSNFSLNIVVVFEDDELGIAEKRVLNIAIPSTIEAITSEIEALGTRICDAANTETLIKTLLNTVIEIK